MIKISALFFIILVAINSSFALEITPVDASMLPSQSSRAQLMEIMVNVQTEDSPKTIAQFVGQLRDILGKLVAAQAKHEAIHKEMMKQCFDEAAYRKKEIQAAERAFARANKSRSRCQASLKSALAALPELQRTHRSYKAELKRASDARKEENRKYQLRRADYKEAIAFLTQFIAYVNKKLKGQFKTFALVEMSENLLKHASRLNVISEAVPVLVALATDPIFAERKANNYEYQPNEVLAAQLKNLLNQLLARLKSDHKQNNLAERKSAKAFADYAAKLNNIISTLKRNIKRTKQQITDMNRCVDTENGIIAKASAKNARNAKLRDAAAKMCHSFNNEFIDATLNRLDEIQTMKDILVIVQRRFKKIPADLIDYLESVKNQWKAYINNTEFKRFVEYKRKAHVDNKRGALLASSRHHVKDSQLAARR
jgi:hypothetical protein